MTESSPVTHVQPEEGATLGGCGVPIPNTISKIIDIETGKLLGHNEVRDNFLLRHFREKITFIFILNRMVSCVLLAHKS